ncbi:hypothetical protein SCHPADRAFT_1000776 [Schizopora paradoxa]|uniref:Mixed lineage kinase domain-containing protein n=1 Tax=Schizopora paradoxa TaxID=27342 RepID=A0A0H2RV58_9AGAM|nr:hypothetical protein SCHPADRAFT_1000776 [Schizopora paradoxa]
MTSSKQTSLIPGDAQQIVSVLQQIGRCTPILGASIESLCGLVLMIASKIDEMKNARAQVRNLVENVLEVSTSVCQILQNYCGAEREDDVLVQKLDCFVKSIEEAVEFVIAYLQKRICRRFFDSKSDSAKVKELRQSMYDSMHSFMLATTFHIHLGVKNLTRKMSVMTKEVQETHLLVQEILHLQRLSQKLSEGRSQTMQCLVGPNTYQPKVVRRKGSGQFLLNLGDGIEHDGDELEDDDGVGAILNFRDDNVEQVPNIVREHEPPPFDCYTSTIINAHVQDSPMPVAAGEVPLANREVLSPSGNFIPNATSSTITQAQHVCNSDRKLLKARWDVLVTNLEYVMGVFKETEERGGRWDVNGGKFKRVKIILSTTRKVFSLL